MLSGEWNNIWQLSWFMTYKVWSNPNELVQTELNPFGLQDDSWTVNKYVESFNYFNIWGKQLQGPPKDPVILEHICMFHIH